MPGQGDAANEVRGLIEERAKAIRTKDIEAVLSFEANDVLLYDALDSLQRHGAESVREKTTEWLSWYDGPVGYEISDLTVSAGEDVAFCSHLYRVTGTMKTGASVDMWVRSTVCLRKVGDAWKVVHEHTSVPFDAESGQALVNLEP